MSTAVAYHNILAAVPIYAGEHPVLGRSAKIARKTQGAITLMHVMESAEGPKVAEATDHLKQLMSSQPLVRETTVVTGHTWSSITDVASERNADLIVLGSRFHGQLRALIGATSDRVLRHAKRDVLVVRRDLYDEQNPPKEFKRVVAAVDLRDHAENVAERATGLASACGAELTLLNVLDHFPVDRENDEITPEHEDPFRYQRNKRAHGLDTLAKAVGGGDVAQEVMVTNAPAGRAVPAYAKEHGADLVIIGSHVKYGADVLFGATADAIVRRAPCDVLVVFAGD